MSGLGATLAALLLAQSADPSAAPQYQTVVVAARPASADGSFVLGRREAASLPGAGGDPGRALENAPGVGRLVANSDGLAIWGTTPAEGRILFDGVEIPALFHFGNWRTVVPGDAIRQLTLLPGAFGADLGRAVGAIVQIDSASASPGRPHAWGAADMFDATLGAKGSVGDSTGFLVTGRLGYMDQLKSLAPSSINLQLTPLPSYRDLFLKLQTELETGQLTFELLGAADTRHFNLPASSPVAVLNQQRERSFTRAVLRYVQAADGESLSVLAFAGRDTDRLAEQFGLVPIAQDVTTTTVGLRLARAVWTDQQRLELGIDGLMAIWSLDRTGSLMVPPREGDGTVFGAMPGGATGSDTWRPVLGNLGPYAQGEWQWRSLRLRAGFRLDGIVISGDRTLPPTGLTPRSGFSRTYWSPEPRLAGTWNANTWLAFSLAGGIHHQAPAATDLSAVTGSPQLGPSRGLAAIASVSARGSEGDVELAGFARRLDSLATRNPDETPRLAENLIATGQGRTVGMQITARRTCAQGWCPWLSYTLSRAQRRSGANSAWRLFDGDQTHILSSALSYRRPHWNAGVRLRISTGLPRTPVTGSYFDTSLGVYRPILGAPNSTRLPSFVELDLRAERSWTQGRWRWTVSGEVLNLTSHENVEKIVYAGDYSSHSFIRGLPIMALAGVRLEI